ncbi:tlde1 domain-containing protein [Erwinia sp. ErVv1]|uniref:tlde1 domain-containing protein n=1 Tax=Erwinia sp. ErVv1 TaxID=1603299 RepID=UPI0009ED118E|nr:tlde1 domain-containing protein [Erwinia sp. ErVv1]
MDSCAAPSAKGGHNFINFRFLQQCRNFRLHPPGPAGVSLGCITLQHRTDFLAIRQALLSTQQIKLLNGLMA